MGQDKRCWDDDVEDRPRTALGGALAMGGRVRVSVLTRGLSILVAILLIGAGLCAGPPVDQDDFRSSGWAQRVGDEIAIRSLAFARDGRTVGLTEFDGNASLWDAVSGQSRPVVRNSDVLLRALAFAPDGRTLAINDRACVVVLKDLDSGVTRHEIATAPIEVRALEFAPDGKTLAISGCDGEVLLWDLVAHRRRVHFQGHQGVVNAIAFAPDGRTIASSGGEGTITLWDPETGLVRATLAGHPRTLDSQFICLKALAFSPDGATLASTALLEPNIRIWDVASGRLRAALPQRCCFVSSLGFTPDGQVLATATDRSVTFWDVATGQVLRSVPIDRVPFSALAFTPDGKRLALGGIDGEITIWETARVLSKGGPTDHRGKVGTPLK
jgi:WD40 repeat protein